MKNKIGIIGDYDASFEPHRATNAALAHARTPLILGFLNATQNDCDVHQTRQQRADQSDPVSLDR